MSLDIPSLIFITGADGAGKSRIAEWLVEKLHEQGFRTGLTWSRFNNYLSKPLLALARLSGHNFYRTVDGVLFGFHNFEKLYGYRYLFALLQAIDVNIAAMKKIKSQRNRFDILVCDRGPWDTLADVIADTGIENLFEGKLSKLYTIQIMTDAKVLFVKRSKDNIIKTRPEMIHDYKLDRKLSIYNHLAKLHNWTVIDNNRSIETTYKEIARLLKLEIMN